MQDYKMCNIYWAKLTIHCESNTR